MRIGGIEAGGTKIICGVGEWNGTRIEILEEARFPATEGAVVIPELVEWFRNHPVAALGIASFGPLDLNKKSDTYGYVMDTPKKGWQRVDFVSPFKETFGIPVAFDTDVNGAALGEVMHGAGRGLDSLCYITVGTGIGVGIYSGGKLLHGLLHPEAGHMKVTRMEGDTFEGICKAHQREGNMVCCEGFACGPAIEKRWGMKAEYLMDRPEVWEMEAHYISQLVSDLVLTVSPEKIVLGGGVMHQEVLFPLIRKKVQEQINHYIRMPQLEEGIERYIVPPALGDHAGLIGAIELGKEELLGK